MNDEQVVSKHSLLDSAALEFYEMHTCTTLYVQFFILMIKRQMSVSSSQVYYSFMRSSDNSKHGVSSRKILLNRRRRLA